MITIGLIIFCVFLSTCLFVSLKKNVDLLDVLERVEDSVDESLDILDEQYSAIDKKSKLEVFSDEPVVRDLIQDIVVARDAVLRVAYIMNNSSEEVIEEEIDNL